MTSSAALAEQGWSAALRTDAAAAAGLTHLQQLEAESIYILREAVAETDKPVLLYSIGKELLGPAAPGVESLLSGQAAVPAAARRYELEVSRHDRVSRSPRARAGP